LNVRMAVTAILLCIVVLLSGCGQVVETMRRGAEVMHKAALRITPTAPAITPMPSPTATLWPTITPTPTPTAEVIQPTAPTTAAVTATATAIPKAQPDDDTFTIEITEQELNEYLKAESFSGQGLTISDVAVTLTPQQAIVNMLATHRDLGMSVGVTLYGQPQVIDGVIYLQITRVELDDSVRGFTRIIAQALVEAALNQYARPHGIPIIIENVVVEEARLAQGKLIVTGRIAP
jgi:hypothetical protein